MEWFSSPNLVSGPSASVRSQDGWNRRKLTWNNWLQQKYQNVSISFSFAWSLALYTIMEVCSDIINNGEVEENPCRLALHECKWNRWLGTARLHIEHENGSKIQNVIIFVKKRQESSEDAGVHWVSMYQIEHSGISHWIPWNLFRWLLDVYFVHCALYTLLPFFQQMFVPTWELISRR